MVRGLKFVPAVVLSLGIVFAARSASATHDWGCYHWPRSSNPFTVTFGSDLTGEWPQYLTKAAADWSLTSGACNNPDNPVRCVVVAGATNPKNCRPANGKVEVCNSRYGNNGWLGLAQIWVSGCHITKAAVKVNDYYMNSAPYNSAAWRSYVMDQETGHALGLDHQDENQTNADLLDACGRGSCMDYSNEPSDNTTPNEHDYDQLVAIYSHLDTTTQTASSPSHDHAEALEPASWGQAVRYARGRPVRFERTLGQDEVLVTWVLWTE